MVNTRLLKAKIVESGETQRSIAKEMDMHYITFNGKLHNRGEFRGLEAAYLKNRLNIADDEASRYFYAQKMECESTTA